MSPEKSGSGPKPLVQTTLPGMSEPPFPQAPGAKVPANTTGEPQLLPWYLRTNRRAGESGMDKSVPKGDRD